MTMVTKSFRMTEDMESRLEYIVSQVHGLSYSELCRSCLDMGLAQIEAALRLFYYLGFSLRKSGTSDAMQ